MMQENDAASLPQANCAGEIYRRDRRIALVFFLILWLSYAYFSHGGSWGANAYLDLTRAVVEEKTFRIDAYVWNTGDWSKVVDHYYINKNPGASFLAAPVYFIYHLFDKNAFSDFVSARIAIHVITAFSFSLLAALAGSVFFLWLRRFAAVGPAIGAAAIFGLGTSQFSNASFFNAAIVVSSFYILAAFMLDRTRDSEMTSARAGIYTFLSGLCLGLAVVAEPISVFGIVIFAAFLIMQRRNIHTWLKFILGGTGPAIVLIIYNTCVIGKPFGTVYEFQNPVFSYDGAFLDVFRYPSLDILYRITFHPIRGLFWVTPVLTLSIFGIISLWRQEKTRQLGMLCASMILFYFLFNISFVAWHGGWYIGPRYLTPALPFFVAPLIFAFQRSGWLSRLAVSLAALSAAIQLTIVAVNPFCPQLPAITNPLFQYTWPNFFSNMVSINNASAFPRMPRHVSRIFSLESFEEWWAAYNLGEVLGLQGVASLLPLILAWMLAGLVLYKITTEP
jgi:hypothetical protein